VAERISSGAARRSGDGEWGGGSRGCAIGGRSADVGMPRGGRAVQREWRETPGEIGSASGENGDGVSGVADYGPIV
jgi:hypothetical protein